MTALPQTERPPVRTGVVPVVSTLAGSCVALAPTIASVPVLPPVGFLVLIGWRLLRPELWSAWVALPLGLADDLIGGAPLGSAAAIWTLTLLALDGVDERLLWRDWGIDWLLALGAIVFALLAGWSFAALTGGGSALWTLAPQALLSLLAFPAVARIVAALDAWRLKR